MKSYRLTVALLLVSGLLNGAAAGDDLKQIKASKKAKAINAYLEKIGLNNPHILKLAQGVNARMENGALRLAEQKYEKGRVVLLYDVGRGFGTKQLQLKFQPDNSNFEYTATPKSIMMNYSFSF
jgi:hypothetical protein